MKEIKVRILECILGIVMVITAIFVMPIAVHAEELQTLKDYEEFVTNSSGNGYISNVLDYGFVGSDFTISLDKQLAVINEANTSLKPDGTMGFYANDYEPVMGKIILYVESANGEPVVEFYVDDSEMLSTHKMISAGSGKYALVCEIPEDVIYVSMKNASMNQVSITKAVMVRRGKIYPDEPKQEESAPEEPKSEEPKQPAPSKPGSTVKQSDVKENATVSHTACLRKKATSGSKALMKLKKGQKIQLLTRNRKWYKVKVGNKTGYVRAKYVSWKGKVVPAKKNGTIRLRSKATISSRSRGKYKADTAVTVIDCNGKWYKIKIGKKTGYMKMKRVYL